MGRPTNAEIAARSQPKTINVTYIPREDGEPSTVTWNNHTFRANVPVPVSHAGMIEQARGNPWFQVDGDNKPDAVPGAPETAEDYRAYAVEWMKSANSYGEMTRRWDNEAELREQCGVGTDDLDYLESVFGPKRAELKRASEAS